MPHLVAGGGGPRPRDCWGSRPAWLAAGPIQAAPGSPVTAIHASGSTRLTPSPPAPLRLHRRPGVITVGSDSTSLLTRRSDRRGRRSARTIEHESAAHGLALSARQYSSDRRPVHSTKSKGVDTCSVVTAIVIARARSSTRRSLGSRLIASPRLSSSPAIINWWSSTISLRA